MGGSWEMVNPGRQRVSTWMIKRTGIFSASRREMSRSKIASQWRFRARLCQGITRDGGAEPLDDVTVVSVMRLDQEDAED